MAQVALTFPDSTYSSSNKPSVATLKSDLQAIETAHNDLDTNAVTATSTTVMTNKTLTAPVITSPVIRTWDGWQSVADTWAYASATTITVPSGAASLYQKGDKIKLTANSVVLYAYVASVSDTVLTVIGNPLTNHTFTNVFVSRAESPFGFPTTFAYTPTFASSGTQPVLGSSTITGKFWMKGTVCWYTGKLAVTTGGAWSSGTGTYRFGLPVTSSAQQYRGQGTAFDSGTADFPQLSETQASTAYCILVQCSNGNNVGASTPMIPATGDYYIWTGFFDF